MKKQNVIQKALIVMAILVSQSCLASTVMHLDSDDIIKRAQYIVTGSVVAIDVTREKANMLFSYITVEVDSVHKNNPEAPLYEKARIVLRQLGGSRDDTSLDVEGLPKFSVGDKVFLNLKQDKNLYYYTVANAAGAFQIVNDNMLISNAGNEGTMFARQGSDGQISFEPGKIEKISMEEMIAKINRVEKEKEKEKEEE